MKAKVAIVGRPNVGKSALFNRIASRRISIVDAQAGITRDRIYADVHWGHKNFELVDTGGLVIGSEENWDKLIKFQAEIAIAETDRILFVCDVNDGLTSLDREIFDMLRRGGKEIIVCVNKVDNHEKEMDVVEFFSLGEKAYGISAIHGLGIDVILDAVTEGFETEWIEEADMIKIAIVGKPNVGKSSIVNYLLGDERSIVSNIPGTTRDSVDTILVQEDQKYLLIDTAGIKTTKRIKESVEYFSWVRTIASVGRTDVVVLVIDGVSGITTGDLKIADMIIEEGKSVIIVVNKWDLVKGITMKAYEREIFNQMPFLSYAPVLFTSAKTGRNVEDIPKLATMVNERGKINIDTRELNVFLEKVQAKHQPPLMSGKRLKLFYMTQIGSLPPTFLVFVNYKALVKDSYESYMINSLRREFDFSGNHVIFKYRNRKD